MVQDIQQPPRNRINGALHRVHSDRQTGQQSQCGQFRDAQTGVLGSDGFRQLPLQQANQALMRHKGCIDIQPFLRQSQHPAQGQSMGGQTGGVPEQGKFRFPAPQLAHPGRGLYQPGGDLVGAQSRGLWPIRAFWHLGPRHDPGHPAIHTLC